MCGIAGFCDFTNSSNEMILRKMTDTLIHRGPDDSGYKFNHLYGAQIGLGHRRLSIIDLSPLGHQPMSFHDYDIVFNGEIYNFSEVRSDLEKYGYQFRSHSDTEVILTGFHKWGIQVLDKLIGMFSFVLFDKKEGKLYVVRDRVGVKPLYYYNQNEVLLFASELKAFHEHPGFKKALNMTGLTTYFQFGYSISPETIFDGAKQVRPGHYVEFDISRKVLTEIPYWSIENFYLNKAKLSEEEILTELELLLTSASNYRLVADVPVGLFLSGGYDSSMIASLLQKNRTEKIKTFTIGFKEDNFNEAPHAKKIAAYLGTDHTEHYCSMTDALELIPKMPYFFDEPYADYSSIPTMLVSQLAKKNVKVALSADGGDELFGGYPKYLHALNYQKYRSVLPAQLANSVRNVYDFASSRLIDNVGNLIKYETTNNKISELITGMTAIDFARINVQQFEERALTKLLNGRENRQPHLFYNTDFFSHFDGLDRLLLLDFKVYLPDDLLVKIDRATMAVSLEGREPLLDHRLIEFVGKVDSASKLNYSKGTLKYYLKKIAHKNIPEHLLNRPKMGFTPPLANWMRGPLKDYVVDYLSKERIVSQGILNYSVIDRLKRDFYELSYDKAAKKLWNLLMFQMWYERWMD